MPTFIKMVAKLEEPAGFFGDDFRAVALFGGIGLLLTLNAVGKGCRASGSGLSPVTCEHSGLFSSAVRRRGTLLANNFEMPEKSIANFNRKRMVISAAATPT